MGGPVPAFELRVKPRVGGKIMFTASILLTGETTYGATRFAAAGVRQLIRARFAASEVLFAVLPTADSGVTVGRPGGDHHSADPVAIRTPAQ